MPVYLFAFGLLLVFEPNFGLLPSPVFFSPEDYEAPLTNPWHFFAAMLVPWILVAAPFGAVVMRLARVAIREGIESDYVRTAAAKGLSKRKVMRQAARPSHAGTLHRGGWTPAARQMPASRSPTGRGSPFVRTYARPCAAGARSRAAEMPLAALSM